MKFYLGNLLLSSVNILTAYACGGTYTATSGEFTSPGYPTGYNSGQTCTYNIGQSTGVLLKLSFPDFETEGGYDFVNVFNSSDVLVARLTGDRSGTVISSSSSYRVELTSDPWTTKRGFRAVWAVAPSSTVSLDLGPHILCPLSVTFNLEDVPASEVKVYETLYTVKADCQTLCLLLSACVYHHFEDSGCTMYEYEFGASVNLQGGFTKINN